MLTKSLPYVLFKAFHLAGVKYWLTDILGVVIYLYHGVMLIGLVLWSVVVCLGVHCLVNIFECVVHHASTKLSHSRSPRGRSDSTVHTHSLSIDLPCSLTCSFRPERLFDIRLTSKVIKRHIHRFLDPCFELLGHIVGHKPPLWQDSTIVQYSVVLPTDVKHATRVGQVYGSWVVHETRRRLSVIVICVASHEWDGVRGLKIYLLWVRMTLLEGAISVVIGTLVCFLFVSL